MRGVRVCTRQHTSGEQSEQSVPSLWSYCEAAHIWCTHVWGSTHMVYIRMRQHKYGVHTYEAARVRWTKRATYQACDLSASSVAPFVQRLPWAPDIYMRMYVCMYVCMYVDMHIWKYVLMCDGLLERLTHTCICVCVSMYMYVCMYVCRYTYFKVCMLLSCDGFLECLTYTCVCMYVCMYVRMYAQDIYVPSMDRFRNKCRERTLKPFRTLPPKKKLSGHPLPAFQLGNCKN